MQLAKLESIFQEIWEHDSSANGRGKAWLNGFQKWTFILMFGFFTCAGLIALTSKFNPAQWHKPVALLFVLGTLLTGFLYQLSLVFTALRIFKAPARHFLEPVTASAAKDFQLANSFTRFGQAELLYAKNRLGMESTHMRARTAILVGALEKVGIFPVLIAWVLASYKYLADGTVAFEQIDWIAYGLLGLYIATLPALFFVHKLERYTLLIDTALEIKRHASGST